MHIDGKHYRQKSFFPIIRLFTSIYLARNTSLKRYWYILFEIISQEQKNNQGRKWDRKHSGVKIGVKLSQQMFFKCHSTGGRNMSSTNQHLYGSKNIIRIQIQCLTSAYSSGHSGHQDSLKVPWTQWLRLKRIKKSLWENNFFNMLQL